MACIDGLCVTSLATAARRSGPTSWELSRLHVRPGTEETVVDLLTAVFTTASERGATQLAARLMAGDHIGEVLRRAGLFLAYSETLYRARGTGRPLRRYPGIRLRHAGDEHGLFRLYSACTPSEVRALEGMTLDQWRASQWSVSGWSISGRKRGVAEYVLEVDSQVVGWLRVVRRFGTADVTVMLHLERSGDDADHLLELGLSAVPIGKQVNMLVPEYQPAVASAAARAGLTIEGEMEVHIRATRATEKIFKEVGAYEVVSP